MNDTTETRLADIERRLSDLEDLSKSNVTNFKRSRLDRVLLLLKEHDDFLSYGEVGKAFGISRPRVTDLVNLFIKEHVEYKVIKIPSPGRGKAIVKSNYEIYPRSRVTNAGCIYVLSSTRSNGLFKIGRTLDITKRISSLNCGSPDPLKLVHSILSDDPVSAESIIHKKFSAKRTKGEWFALNETDIQFLKSLNYLSGDGLKLFS
jgi:predicted XRE-type DNA-binding protein